jgi:cyclin T
LQIVTLTSSLLQIAEKRRGMPYMDVMQTSDTSHHGIVENSPYRIPYGRHAEGGKLGNSWYFSRKEIEENSVSRKDGIDLKESYFRKAYCTFLQDFGMRLQV